LVMAGLELRKVSKRSSCEPEGGPLEGSRRRKDPAERLAEANKLSACALSAKVKKHLRLQEPGGEGVPVSLCVFSASDIAEWDRTFCMDLLRSNMKDIYGDEWDEKEKEEEFLEEDARIVLVHQYQEVPVNDDGAGPAKCRGTPTRRSCGKGSCVGFAHFRFVEEHGAIVLYVYELQLTEAARGRGIGKLVMGTLKSVALSSGMGGVMLTCFKHNVPAMRFYKALGYTIDAISPSNCDAEYEEEDCNYEILSDIWDPSAKEALAKSRDLARADAKIARAAHAAGLDA